MKLLIIYGDEFLAYDLGEGHPLAQVRLKLAFQLMGQLGIVGSEGVETRAPRPATLEEVLLFHHRAYIDFVAKACASGRGFLDQGDTPAFRGGLEASLIIAGSSVQAADAVWKGEAEHAFNLGGGLHHAHRHRASGFCIFNDPAVAIAFLKHRYKLERIAYIDIDAHHGDGVMYGFYDDPGLVVIDFHEDGRYLFPGSGHRHELGEGAATGLKVNIPLPPHAGDDAFLYAFEALVPPLLQRYRPQIVVMQCGADAHAGDPITHLRFTNNAYMVAARLVHQLSHQLCGGKLVVLGGGGYNPANVSLCWAPIAAELAEVPMGMDIPLPWRKEFAHVVGEPAPERLTELRSGDGALAQVRRHVAWLAQQLGLP